MWEDVVWRFGRGVGFCGINLLGEDVCAEESGVMRGLFSSYLYNTYITRTGGRGLNTT